jgi:hypothetical protein
LCIATENARVEANPVASAAIYGAPTDDADVPKIVEYLAATY